MSQPRKPAKIQIPVFQAERGLLACLVNYPDLAAESDMPRPEHFREQKHQRLAEAIFDLNQRGLAVNSTAVAAHPAMAAELTPTADTEELLDILPARESWRFYAETVGREGAKQTLRDRISLALMHLEADAVSEAEEVLADALEAKSTRPAGPKTIAQLFRELQEMAEENYSRGGDDPGISLPWKELNRRLGGFGDGDLAVVAGVPGGGKTAFALQVAESAARKGPALVFSLEMRGIDLAARMAARRLQTEEGLSLTVRQIQGGRFPDQEGWNAMNQLARRVDREALELLVDDTPVQTVADIARRARAEDRRARDRNQSKRGLRLLIVDYSQLIQNSGTYEARHEEISHAAMVLKMLARGLDCPALLLSQFDAEGMAIISRGGIPNMSNIAGSKDIGKHADSLTYILWENDGGARSKHRGSFHIDKNRQGGLGSFPFYFDGEKMEFREIENR